MPTTFKLSEKESLWLELVGASHRRAVAERDLEDFLADEHGLECWERHLHELQVELDNATRLFNKARDEYHEALRQS